MDTLNSARIRNFKQFYNLCQRLAKNGVKVPPVHNPLICNSKGQWVYLY